MAKNKLYWEKEKKKRRKENRKRKKKRKNKRKKRRKRERKREEKRVGEGYRNQKEKKHGGVSSDSVYFKSLDFPWNLSI